MLIETIQKYSSYATKVFIITDFLRFNANADDQCEIKALEPL